MRLPGNMETSVILCNKCEKRISVKGIRFQTIRRGEYAVDFFACPHCGKTYLINTTDKRQRELLHKMKYAKGKQREKLHGEIKDRFPKLKDIGENILNGESEARTLESENGGCGPEGV